MGIKITLKIRLGKIHFLRILVHGINSAQLLGGSK